MSPTILYNFQTIENNNYPVAAVTASKAQFHRLEFLKKVIVEFGKIFFIHILLKINLKVLIKIFNSFLIITYLLFFNVFKNLTIILYAYLLPFLKIYLKCNLFVFLKIQLFSN